ncbi:MAG TPA: VTT domain-containing protein [Bryobacteraceae bacterium]|nr:VTT domain-containing protein [Bryobacteraceae bacterium]
MLHNIADFLVALGPWGLLLLAVLDSSGLPIANSLDAYLIFLSVKDPHRAYWYAALSVGGSVLGNLVLFLIAKHGGGRFMRKIEPGREQRFRHWFQRFGLVTVFVPALMPIPMPLKLFVISAGALRTRLEPFLLVILAARIPRYLGEAALGIKLGQQSTRFLKDHMWDFVAAAVVLFIVLYLLVIANERWRNYRRRRAQS